ncbi:Gfo/Idh/MocA family protein [Microvirga sp. VF16]|uniref:Gfo/Idh/MocA family protein n=1 Tax=Microvirga sp. VF16 TaxID=2807101 RepID=UPI00193E6D6F|nr:Gfo/Idh/MocA family oxidoreductase [Microvirga sp. VF16]QRM29971.1 Gfo/Idh/MocA family oxidoreductase [Microvirga sp. VF16]
MRVCLLGVSHWHAAMHLDAVRASGGAVIAVWDQDARAGADFAGAHGLAACQSVGQALANRPDLVVLMGSPREVPDIALGVVAADIPMVLEKPAASTTGELLRIVKAARSQGRFVGVPLPNRFGPVFQAMAELEAEGRLGKLAHAHFRIVNGPPQRYRDDGVGWMLDPAVGGGGALRNLGIHGVDAALSVAQGTLRVISASIGNRIHGERVEDHALLILHDEAGTLFTVEAGYTYASMAPGGDFEWRIATGNAYLIDRGEAAQCATLDDGHTRALAPEHPSTRYRLFMADTFARLRSGEAPAVDIEDYLAAMQIIDAAYERANA